MTRLNKYDDFLNESKLELLLEANISYGGKLMDILNSIDSPIVNKLLKSTHEDKEYGIGIVDFTKTNDIVAFTNQTENLPVKIINNGQTFDGLGKKAERLNLFDIKNTTVSNNGDTGVIIKYFTPYDLAKISSEVGHWINVYKNEQLVHFRSNNLDNGDSIISTNGIEIDFNKVRKTEIKIGRLVKKILDKLGEEYSDSQIEDFVNRYKSKVDLLNRSIEESFSIVKGEDIKKFYLENNYESTSNTLGNSCMRYRRCQMFLDIYTGNKNVELLILRSDKYEDKIKGRALIWTTKDGKKFMDRVYINKDSDTNLFIEYANRNGFIYKSTQNSTSDERLLLNGDRFNHNIVVEVHPYDHDLYPYMDTLKFYNHNEGILTNDNNMFKSYFKLESTAGGKQEYD